MRKERRGLRQAAITAGILTAMGVCTLGWGHETSVGGRSS